MKKIKEAEDILKLVHFHLFRKLPMIRQTETSECGLACLAMLASYYGWRTDIIELRKVYPLSLNGSNLQGLMYIASKMNFSSRALRAKLSALNKLNVPCILHWKMNHFVVLKKATRDKIVIHDPEQGLQALTLKQASPFFTGVAVEFHPTEFFNNKAAPRRMKLSDLWSGIWGLKKAIGYTFLLSAFIQILALAMPFYMQIVVDEVLPKYDDDLLFVVAAGFALLMLINVGVGYMRSVLMLYVGSSLNIQMTRNLFHHYGRYSQPLRLHQTDWQSFFRGYSRRDHRWRNGDIYRRYHDDLQPQACRDRHCRDYSVCDGPVCAVWRDQVAPAERAGR